METAEEMIGVLKTSENLTAEEVGALREQVRAVGMRGTMGLDESEMRRRYNEDAENTPIPIALIQLLNSRPCPCHEHDKTV